MPNFTFSNKRPASTHALITPFLHHIFLIAQAHPTDNDFLQAVYQLTIPKPAHSADRPILFRPPPPPLGF